MEDFRHNTQQFIDVTACLGMDLKVRKWWHSSAARRFGKEY